MINMTPFLWIVLCTVGVISTSANLLLNPSFDEGTVSWHYKVWGDAKSTAQIMKSETGQYLSLEVSSPGSHIWNIELQQHNVKFESGASYRLTVRMACAKERPVGLAFVDVVPNKELFRGLVNCGSSQGANCISGYCDYSADFLADKEYDGRIKLQFGGSSTAVLVDDVTLTKQEYLPPSSEPTKTPQPSTSAVTGSVPCDGGDAAWVETFRDEFNGNMNDVQKSWNLYHSPGHAGNGLRRGSAFSAGNGKLTITARKENGVTVSGGMSSKIKQQYGCYVVKVRTENDPSESLSGVVLTWPDQYPRGGENDFYETLSNKERNPFYSFFHSETVLPQAYMEHKYDARDWHEVAMMWTPDVIKVYIDGKFEQETRDKRFIPHYGIDHVMTIQLDAKNKNDLGTNVVKMEVDWIRSYRAK